MGLRTLRPSWEGGAGDPQVKGAVRGRDPHTTCTPPSLAAVAGDGGGEATERADHGQLRRGPVSRASRPGPRYVASCSNQKVGDANGGPIWTKWGEPHSCDQCLEVSGLGPEEGSRLEGSPGLS